jgi:hypothetical protein
VLPGRDADPLPPSNAEVKNRVILLLSPRAFVAYEMVKTRNLLLLPEIELWIVQPVAIPIELSRLFCCGLGLSVYM